MSNHESEPNPDREDAFFNFFSGGDEEISDPEVLSRLLGQDDWEEEVTAILNAALRDVPKLCPHCQDLCPDHVVRLRDAFMNRGEQMALALARQINLYRQLREVEIYQPVELLRKIYDTWRELFILYPLTEPQSQMDEDN